MALLRITAAWAAIILFAGAVWFCVPAAIEAGTLLAIEDEPAAIADRALANSFNADVAVREIEAALAVDDVDLAESFLELAANRGIAVPPALTARVSAAVERANSATVHAANFVRGFVTGEPENAVALAGTATGDLFVFGDIRDAVREGGRYVKGETADELVLGLALVGIAVTAGTYASVGAAAPARVGLSVAKVARKVGRAGSHMTDWIGRTVREVVDLSALKRAGAAIATPAVAVRIARDAVKADKAKVLAKFAGDLGQVQTRAGTRAAVDALKVAHGPQDVTRIARLAEKKGGQTRAILKLLGRGAILLTVATLNLAWWILGAIMSVSGLVSSLKSDVERMTQRYLDRRRARRHLAMAAAQA